MADTRPDWKPSQRTIREEQERGLTKLITSKALKNYLKGPTLEEMLAEDESLENRGEQVDY